MLVQPAWITDTCFAGRSLWWMLTALGGIGKLPAPPQRTCSLGTPVSRTTNCLKAVAQAELDAAAVVGGVGPPKQRRAQYAAHTGYIHVIQDVRGTNVYSQGLRVLG